MKILNVVNRVRYFLDKFLFILFRKSQNLEIFKDAWKGEPVVIVGNGPSLKQTPLDDFSSFKSIITTRAPPATSLRVVASPRPDTPPDTIADTSWIIMDLLSLVGF